MVLSMTGYGKCSESVSEKKLMFEIRSLNSKSFDLNLRIPFSYKSKEIEIRKLLNDKLIRGKVDVSIYCDTQENKSYSINQSIVQSYIKELKNIDSNLPEAEYIKMSMRLPEVLSSPESEVNENEWKDFTSALESAISEHFQFRKQEGKALENEFVIQIQIIQDLLQKVSLFENDRTTKLREKLQKQLADLQIEYDEQRFHQEMIYYIEKLDISEEKMRLAHHLQYFLDTLASDEQLIGKKLGFIAQEIGREINTLGSKCNHQDIQKLVVQMKDSLEKIKEQTYNVL